MASSTIGTPVTFEMNGTVRDGARVDLEQEDAVVADDELAVDQPAHADGAGEA